MSQSVLTAVVAFIVCGSCLPLTTAEEVLSESAYKQQVIVNPFDISESCCNCSIIEEMASGKLDGINQLLSKLEELSTDILAKIDSKGGKLTRFNIPKFEPLPHVCFYLWHRFLVILPGGAPNLIHVDSVT